MAAVLVLAGPPALVPGAAAQTPLQRYRPMAEYLSSENGLAQSRVSSLLEDDWGRIWAGTQDGISVLDGNRLRTLKARVDVPESLQSPIIYDLERGPGGNVWVTSEQGVDEIDARSFAVRHRISDQGAVHSLRFTDAHQLLYISGGRLQQLNPDDGTRRSLLPALDHVRQIYPAPDGSLIVVTDRGIASAARLGDGGYGAPSPLLEHAALDVSRIKALLPDAHARLWISLAGQGLRLCRIGHAACDEWSTRTRRLPADNIASIVADADGAWLASDHGLLHLDPDTAEVRQLLPQTPNDAYDAARIALTVLPARDGTLWLGTFNGLYRLPADYRDVAAFHVSTQRFVESVAAIARWPEGGEDQLAIAAADGISFWSLNGDEPHWLHQTPYPQPLDPVRLQTVDGELLINTLTQGSFLLDPARSRYRPLATRYPGAGKRGTAFLLDAGDGWHLLQSDRQLIGYQRQAQRWQQQWRQTLPVGQVATLRRWHHWLLLGAYQQGLLAAPWDTPSVTPGRWQRIQGAGTVLDLHPVDDSRLLVLTADRGLLLQTLDGEGQPHLQALPVSQQLNDAATLCAVTDGDGLTAVSTHQGVAVLDADLQLKASLTVLQGLNQQEFHQFDCTLLNGQPLFGGGQGLSLLRQPQALASPPPQLRWMDVVADGQRRELQDGDGDALSLISPEMLQISAAILPTQLPRAARFSYRLLPGDPRWLDAQAPTLSFTNIRPGQYELQMRAEDYAGTRSPIRTLAFRILPPWWASLWALMAYGAAVLLVLHAIISSRWRAHRASLALAQETNRQQAAYARELEEQVRQRTQELELKRNEAIRANLDKTRFIASASHDLKHPLSVIRLQLANAERDVTSLPRSMQAIAASAGTLDALVDTIVELAKFDANTVTPHWERVSPRTLLSELTASFGPLAQARGTQLRLDCASDTPVHTDALLLRRILANLLDNAIKLTAPGSSIELVAAAPQGTHLPLSVLDRGPGMPTEARERLFEPFQRGTAQYPGSGLGLSIVARSCALLDIDVGVHDRHGGGTEFTLRIPLAADPGTTRAPGDAPECRHIAVVDDDASLRQWLSSTLIARGHAVQAHASAESLLTAGDEFDLILSDLDLGDGLDGIAALPRYREHLRTGGEIILMSGDRSLRARLPDQTRILLKPVRLARLFWLLQQTASTEPT